MMRVSTEACELLGGKLRPTRSARDLVVLEVPIDEPPHADLDRYPNGDCVAARSPENTTHVNSPRRLRFVHFCSRDARHFARNLSTGRSLACKGSPHFRGRCCAPWLPGPVRWRH